MAEELDLGKPSAFLTEPQGEAQEAPEVDVESIEDDVPRPRE